MPSITINGKKCDFDGKKMILQVANEAGVNLPQYCYHEGLSVVASCRICLAEVWQPNPRNNNTPELIPKLVPTCQTMASDGMIIDTTTPRSIANQKAVMEYLLINHPLDCPVCDQAGECHLQDYSYAYGRSESRFEEEKIKQPKKDLGPNVWLYADRCIMCSRCVRFTREVTGTSEIGVFGRGAREEIDIFPGKALDNELSANVVDLCPVGALLDKDFLFQQRVWLLKRTPSIDGTTSGGDNLWIEHNEGRIYRVKPRANASVNKWWISDEVRYGWKFVHSPERLTSPTVKVHGLPEACDGARALAQARSGLTHVVRTHGEGSLAVMVSPMLSCEEAFLLGELTRGVDPAAVLAVGPVPVDGVDKAFPGGYTVRAEKCPNSRGVRRALELIGLNVRGYDEFLQMLDGGAVRGVILTGHYPSNWVTPDLLAALKDKFTLVIDVLGNALTQRADVLLPGATWVEKSGTFENVDGRLQCFEQAIPVLEGARADGQIALDLAAALGQIGRTPFDAAAVRQRMGGLFAQAVHAPAQRARVEADMEYVTL